MSGRPVFIGTAGWSVPKPFADLFPAEGSHLERYARVFSGVEINSSFYRDHQAKTYARWAASVPEHFRFSVKLSKVITHECALDVDPALIAEKLEGFRSLGPKLGVVLIQLPPSLAFSLRECTRFFSRYRVLFDGPTAIEPRHLTWTTAEAKALLEEFRISKVMADPERCPIDDFGVLTAGGFYYLRLHGSPVIYRSEYSEPLLREVAATVDEANALLPGWCIFDNTTFGFATRDARRVEELRHGA